MLRWLLFWWIHAPSLSGFFWVFYRLFFIYFIKTDDPNIIIFLCLDLSFSVIVLVVSFLRVRLRFLIFFLLSLSHENTKLCDSSLSFGLLFKSTLCKAVTYFNNVHILDSLSSQFSNFFNNPLPPTVFYIYYHGTIRSFRVGDFLFPIFVLFMAL